MTALNDQPTVMLSLTELATITMLVEGAHTMNSEQTRLALGRTPVIESAIARLKDALVQAGAEQHGPGWRPRTSDAPAPTQVRKRPTRR